MDTVMTSGSSSGTFMLEEPEIVSILSVEEFAEKCLRFNAAHPDVVLAIERGVDCPVHIYAEEIGQKACKTAVSGIKNCPVCGKPMCPHCGNHSVSQLSRVTGYIGEVGGWNDAKKQELLDRQRYNIGVGGVTTRKT